MVLSLTTILDFYGGLPDSIKEQSSSVSDYYANLPAYAIGVHVSDTEILIPCFINGLKIHIHREVFGKKFNSLLDVWLSARICEINFEEKEQPDQEFSITPDQVIEEASISSSSHQPKISDQQNLDVNQAVTKQNIQQSDPTDQHLYSSSTNLEPEIAATKIEIQQIQQRKFSNISTISKSTGINIDLESRDVDEKQPIIGKNGRQEDQDQNRALGGLSIHVGTNLRAIQEKQPPSILDFNSDRVNAVVGGMRSRVEAFPVELMEEDAHRDGRISVSDFNSGERSTGSSGVEDGAVGKGERSKEDESTSIYLDGATTIEDGAATCSGTPRRVSPIVARQPELMAAVFPWDLESEAATTVPSGDGLEG